MLYPTKANEFVAQCSNEVQIEVKLCLNFPSVTSRIVLLFFALLYLKSSKQFSHYYGFRNYIYFSHTL